MINILYPGVLLARDAASDAVKCVELVELDELLSELNPPGRVPDPVQGRRVESEADDVGDDEDDDPADAGLGRETHLGSTWSSLIGRDHGVVDASSELSYVLKRQLKAPKASFLSVFMAQEHISDG